MSKLYLLDVVVKAQGVQVWFFLACRHLYCEYDDFYPAKKTFMRIPKNGCS